VPVLPLVPVLLPLVPVLLPLVPVLLPLVPVPLLPLVPVPLLPELPLPDCANNDDVRKPPIQIASCAIYTTFFILLWHSR
jgi:hypothetical protein